MSFSFFLPGQGLKGESSGSSDSCGCREGNGGPLTGTEKLELVGGLALGIAALTATVWQLHNTFRQEREYRCIAAGIEQRWAEYSPYNIPKDSHTKNIFLGRDKPYFPIEERVAQDGRKVGDLVEKQCLVNSSMYP